MPPICRELAIGWDSDPRSVIGLDAMISLDDGRVFAGRIVRYRPMPGRRLFGTYFVRLIGAADEIPLMIPMVSIGVIGIIAGHSAHDHRRIVERQRRGLPVCDPENPWRTKPIGRMCGAERGRHGL